MTQSRATIHAYLSDQAGEAWHTFADENGVSISGLAESLGLDLAAGIDDPARLEAWVKDARRIDSTRRRRGKAA